MTRPKTTKERILSRASLSELEAALKTAQDEEAVYSALSDLCWYNTHDGQTCPPQQKQSEANLCDNLVDVRHAFVETSLRWKRVMTEAAEFRIDYPDHPENTTILVSMDPIRPEERDTKIVDGKLVVWLPMALSTSRKIKHLLWVAALPDGQRPDGHQFKPVQPYIAISSHEIQQVWRFVSHLPHPLAPVVTALQKMPEPAKPLRDLHVEVSGRSEEVLLNLVTAPTALMTGPLEVIAIAIDGEPIASMLPINYSDKKILQLPKYSDQMRLWPGPQTIDERATTDAIITALADMPLYGDERNPARADMYLVAMLAYALTGHAIIDERDGARFLAGSDSDAAIRRFYNAIAWTDAIRLIASLKTGRWYKLVEASGHPQKHFAYLSAPWWWRESGGTGNGGYRLVGGLWRNRLLTAGKQNKKNRGTDKGYWRVLQRTLSGLEALLTWGPSAGKGRDGRLPSYLKPDKPGGPGPEVFIPWGHGTTRRWRAHAARYGDGICRGETLPPTRR